MSYDRLTKAELIARLELLEAAHGGVTRAVWRCLIDLQARAAASEDVDGVGVWDEARGAIAMELAQGVDSPGVSARDVPAMVQQLREVMAELEPERGDDDAFTKALHDLMQGGGGS